MKNVNKNFEYINVEIENFIIVIEKIIVLFLLLIEQ